MPRLAFRLLGFCGDLPGLTQKIDAGNMRLLAVYLHTSSAQSPFFSGLFNRDVVHASSLTLPETKLIDPKLPRISPCYLSFRIVSYLNSSAQPQRYWSFTNFQCVQRHTYMDAPLKASGRDTCAHQPSAEFVSLRACPRKASPGGMLDSVTASTPPFGLSPLGNRDDCPKRASWQSAPSVAIHMPEPTFPPSDVDLTSNADKK